jgi:hypothetical protein
VQKISNKSRKEILDAISAGCFDAIEEHIPEWKDGTPETWHEETKEKFDLIGDVEHKINKKLDTVLLS